MKNKKQADTPKVSNEVKQVKEKKKEYKVFIKINDKITEVETNDIASAILSAKPEWPKTPLTIRITKDGKTRDRYLQVKDAKRLFTNEITMQMFIKNLLF